MKRIFLGGTYNDSTWRDILMPELDKTDYDYFNPVVDLNGGTSYLSLQSFVKSLK